MRGLNQFFDLKGHLVGAGFRAWGFVVAKIDQLWGYGLEGEFPVTARSSHRRQVPIAVVVSQYGPNTDRLVLLSFTEPDDKNHGAQLIDTPGGVLDE